MAAKKTPSNPAGTGDEDAREIVFGVEAGPFAGGYDDDGDYEIVRPQEGAELFVRTAIEALGTFGLVFVILGTALYLRESFSVAVAAGLVLAGLIGALGHVSGGHFNPAVSLGAALGGYLRWLDMLGYWVAQVVGGLFAAAILWVTLPSGVADQQAFFSSTANGWDTHSPLSTATQGAATFDLKAALILEVVATAIFVAVTLGVVHRRAVAAVGPFAVGFTLAAMLLVTGIATGGGVNPARSTAAAVFSGSEAIGQLWLFWLAPLVGAALAGLVYVAFATPLRDDAEFEEFDDDEDDDIRL
jgi:aquaporin Z